MFVTSAYAQSGGAGGFDFNFIFLIVILGGIMWFLVIRPQRQAAKARDEMLSNIRRNDVVVTGGGLVGKVTKVTDDDSEIEVQIASDIRVKVVRSMIADVRVKGGSSSDASPSKKLEEKQEKGKKK